jgi:hypothetical protein
MDVTLDELISDNRESLVDRIVKDAIGQIPSYAKAPLRVTIERVERALDAISKSIEENDPDVLEQHLMAVAAERREEGYAILELHAIVHIIERHVRDDIVRICSRETECNALLALLDAVMGAARMVLSVRYVLSMGSRA